MSSSGDGPDLNDLKGLYGEYALRIRHEDTLINYRTSWFITIQSFLITGFVVALFGFVQLEIAFHTKSIFSASSLNQKSIQKIETTINLFFHIITVTGIFLSMTTLILLTMAALSIRDVEAKWKSEKQNNLFLVGVDERMFNAMPDFISRHKLGPLRSLIGFIFSMFIPTIFLFLWIGFLLAFRNVEF